MPSLRSEFNSQALPRHAPTPAIASDPMERGSPGPFACGPGVASSACDLRRKPSCHQSSAIRANAEERPVQSLGLLQALLAENDRLVAGRGIGNEALGVQTVHRLPVEALPHARFCMQSEQKQRQHSVIDAVGIYLDLLFPWLALPFPGGPLLGHPFFGAPLLEHLTDPLDRPRCSGPGTGSVLDVGDGLTLISEPDQGRGLLGQPLSLQQEVGHMGICLLGLLQGTACGRRVSAATKSQQSPGPERGGCLIVSIGFGQYSRVPLAPHFKQRIQQQVTDALVVIGVEPQHVLIVADCLFQRLPPKAPEPVAGAPAYRGGSRRGPRKSRHPPRKPPRPRPALRQRPLDRRTRALPPDRWNPIREGGRHRRRRAKALRPRAPKQPFVAWWWPPSQP